MTIASDVACSIRMDKQHAHPANFDAYGHIDCLDLRGYRESPQEGDIEIFMLPNTSGHDLFGYEDPLTLANHEYIADMVESIRGNDEETALVLVRYHNTDRWAVRDGVELSEAEVDMVESLLEYSCLDEDRAEEIGNGWTEDYWKGDGLCDVAREIEDVSWDDVEPVICEVLEGAQAWPSHHENGYPIYMPEDWERIVAGVKSRLVANEDTHEEWFHPDVAALLDAEGGR